MASRTRAVRWFGWSAACGLLALIGCSAPVQEVVEPPTVVVEAVEQRRVPIYTEYVGRAEASLYVEIRARVDGFLERHHFQEGAAVAKGDLLFTIDPKPYEAKVRQAEAQVDRQQAALDKTTRDVARLKPLYEQNAASQLDYDTAISAEEEAAAELVAAQAALEAARLELSYTRITSPIAGLMGRRQVDIGALVGSGGASLLTTVQKVDPVFVTFNLTVEEYLEAKKELAGLGGAGEEFTPGDLVTIHLMDGSRYPYIGDINFTEPSVNPRTGTFQVRAELPNPDRLMLPGQGVRVRLLHDYQFGALLIPEKAIRVEQGGDSVFVLLEDDRVEKRTIRRGRRLDDRVIVEAGLRAGERVIVEGIHKVRHGETAEAVPPTTAEVPDPQAESAVASAEVTVE